MGIIKYTLYCQNGHLFKSGVHYLTLGEWIDYENGRTILEHGIMSEEEAKQILSQSLVNVYQYSQNNRMSIREEYNIKYMKKVIDRRKLESFAGCLHRVSEYEWEGRIRVK